MLWLRTHQHSPTLFWTQFYWSKYPWEKVPKEPDLQPSRCALTKAKRVCKLLHSKFCKFTYRAEDWVPQEPLLSYIPLPLCLCIALWALVHGLTFLTFTPIFSLHSSLHFNLSRLVRACHQNISCNLLLINWMSLLFLFLSLSAGLDLFPTLHSHQDHCLIIQSVGM